jgi:nitrite reductase/ring-hydroxylating ferredoxin subunit
VSDAALTRRRALRYLAAGFATLRCGSKADKPNLDCATEQPDAGGAVGYCLVEPRLVRVAGGRLIGVGEAVLTNVDDNTAVIVARDQAGFHALSAVCTHACCLVSLCRDTNCSSVSTNPGECGSTPLLSPPQVGTAIACPCHGSGFRLEDGSPLGGPALRPLPSYAISVDGDDLLVDTTRTVDPSTRVSA